jgi:hypothetical protein
VMPRRPHDHPKQLSDTDERLQAIEEAVDAAVQKVRDELTGENEMQPNPTPPLGVLWGKGEEASHMRACEAPDGPVGKLRIELKERHEQREKSMNRRLVIIGLLVTVATGGIQLWGKWSERSAAAGEMTTALQQVKAELAALKNIMPKAGDR